MQLNWKESESFNQPEKINNELSVDGVYLRKDIEEVVFTDSNLNEFIKYKYKEVFLPKRYKYDIKDEELYLAKLLEAFKAEMLEENETKARNIEYIRTSLGKLKKETPTAKLESLIPIYKNKVQALGKLPEGYVRLYDNNGNVFFNPELSLEAFNNLISEVDNAYITNDIKFVEIIKSINSAATIQDLENIIIEY